MSSMEFLPTPEQSIWPQKELFLSLCVAMACVRDKEGLDLVVKEYLKKAFHFNDMIILTINPDRQTQKAFFRHFENDRKISPDYARVLSLGKCQVEDGIVDQVLTERRLLVWSIAEVLTRKKIPGYIRFFADNQIKKLAAVPLFHRSEAVGAVFFCSRDERSFSGGDFVFIDAVGKLLSAKVLDIISQEENGKYKQQLEVEKLYLQEEIRTEHNYDEIVGSGPAMRKVYKQVSQVAASLSSVLILGETGTGKELIARALHNTSLRKDKLMVKVNCATLPPNLIESELFGHERGSFTGATERRVGKFELANNSTLFLDEVGELPLDLQVKLLRALQEKEIERVGGTSVIKTDVRVITATNRNLFTEVQQGKFRSDLYFRLNVFPITLPPLRERKEDIPVLAAHFLQKHAKKNVYGPMSLSSRVIRQLMAYHWPGNIRELEHLIERSILLSNGPAILQIHLPIADRDDMKHLLPDTHIKTINEVEREHIISVLKKCNGKVSGIGGAAEKLQIPSTTLNSKIRRLGIKKGYIEK